MVDGSISRAVRMDGVLPAMATARARAMTTGRRTGMKT
jgi:hypothetical protein